MKTLTDTALESAETFLKNKARPLENARWCFHRKSIGIETVLKELAKFANPDGGFGRVLESDMRPG